MRVDEVTGGGETGAWAYLRNSINIHSCNELVLLELLGRIDDEALFVTFEHYPGDVWRNTRSGGPGGIEVVLAGSPDALHAAFTVLAGWLENCGERPYSFNELDEYEVFQTPIQTLAVGDESFMVGYGLNYRDLPFCDHKLVVVRDDDRLVVIDTYGRITVPVLSDKEVVAKAEEAVALLHT